MLDSSVPWISSLHLPRVYLLPSSTCRLRCAQVLRRVPSDILCLCCHPRLFQLRSSWSVNVLQARSDQLTTQHKFAQFGPIRWTDGLQNIDVQMHFFWLCILHYAVFFCICKKPRNAKIFGSDVQMHFFFVAYADKKCILKCIAEKVHMHFFLHSKLHCRNIVS